MGTLTHRSPPLLRRMLWVVVCASHPAQAEEISRWSANTLPACQGAFPQRRKNPQELLQSTAWLQFCKSIVPTGDRTTGWKEIKIQTSSPPASATHAEEPAWLFGNGDRADLLLASESLSAASQIIFSSELPILNFQTGKSEQYCSGKKLVSSAFPCSWRRRVAHTRTTPVVCAHTASQSRFLKQNSPPEHNCLRAEMAKLTLMAHSNHLFCSKKSSDKIMLEGAEG